MKIVTVQFDYPNRPKYSVLLNVFRESCKFYMPKIELVEFRIPPPVNNTGRPLNFNYNTVKLQIWVDFLKKTKENVIFADCDMMAVQSAKHAFDKDFDVAFTARTYTTRIPMNGGIMMARPTDKAIEFFEQMLKVNNEMLADSNFHHKWRCKYAGMNQSAFGYVYEKKKHNAKIHKYTTLEWNAVDCDWHRINEKTVFIHYKSKLRKLVLANKRPLGNFQKAMVLWYEMRDRLGYKGISYARLNPEKKIQGKRLVRIRRVRRTSRRVKR